MKSTRNPEQSSDEPGSSRRWEMSGRPGVSQKGGSDEMLLVGARFETPTKIPFLLSGRYRRLPGFLREWLRAAFGMGTLLFEKMASNKNQAFMDLLAHVQRQQAQLESLSERLAALEGRGGRARPAAFAIGSAAVGQRAARQKAGKQRSRGRR